MTVAQLRPAAETTEPTPTPQAATVYTDMPPNLSKREVTAYTQGWCKGAQAYIRKHGGPGVTLEPGQTVTKEELTARRLEHEAARQPTAHRAGMAGLRKWLAKYATEERTAEILESVKPAKPARKAPARKPAVKPVPVVEAAPVAVEPVETVAETVTRAPMTYAARKASRRELAASLRAAGVDPRGDAWETAKREAGIA